MVLACHASFSLTLGSRIQIHGHNNTEYIRNLSVTLHIGNIATFSRRSRIIEDAWNCKVEEVAASEHWPTKQHTTRQMQNTATSQPPPAS